VAGTRWSLGCACIPLPRTLHGESRGQNPSPIGDYCGVVDVVVVEGCVRHRGHYGSTKPPPREEMGASPSQCSLPATTCIRTATVTRKHQ
jgi:hypothetical protein